MLKSSCPACGNLSKHILDWDFSGLDESVFNYQAQFYGCDNCGLVYIHNITDDQLSKFYQQECSYFERSHFSITKNENISKFQSYRDYLIHHGFSDYPLTDIGCGRGGFLLWLHSNGWKSKCIGVDIDLKSIPIANTIESNDPDALSFVEGFALQLPFNDSTQSILTYYHVLEHIKNIDKLLSESWRVLQPGGHIVIEVPDAEKYNLASIGSAYWLSIREHIYHFSPCSIKHALNKNSFEVIAVERKMLPTPEFEYPSLMILARKVKNNSNEIVCDSSGISEYAMQSKNELTFQVNKVNEFNANVRDVTFWGCSAELFSLLPLLRLDGFTLCDTSPHKQQSYYRANPILSPQAVAPKGHLIIAPYLYRDAIEHDALALGWREEQIYCLG